MVVLTEQVMAEHRALEETAAAALEQEELHLEILVQLILAVAVEEEVMQTLGQEVRQAHFLVTAVQA